MATGNVVSPPNWTTDEATIGHIVAVAPGNVAAGKASVTLTNVGTAEGQVLGNALAVGETITYTAYRDDVAKEVRRLPVIAYTASATAILSISWVD